MTTPEYLILAITLSLSAYFLVSYIRDRLSQQSSRAFEVSFGGGKAMKVEIVTSPTESIHFRVQQILDQAVKQIETPDRTPDLSKFANELEADRRNNPLSCEIHFALARVYRLMNDLPRAIGVWSDYIENKERAGQHDAELAAAYYNRSCYEARLHGDQKDCLKDLDRAKAMSEKYRTMAPNDVDLLAILPKLQRLEEEPPGRTGAA